LWQIFRRNIQLFGVAAAVVLALTSVWVMTQERLYEATATLMIQAAPQPVRTTQLGQGMASINAEAIDTQIRMIQSPLLVKRAADIYADRFRSPNGGAWTSVELAALADKMAHAIRVARDGGSFMIDVTATSPDAEFSAVTANLIVEQYLQAQVESKLGSASDSDVWLTSKLSQLERDAVRAQAAVDGYKVRHRLVSAQGATIAEQEVSTLNQQLAEARANLAERRGRLGAAQAQLTRGGGGADTGAALGSGTIGSLRAQEAVTSAELAQLSVRYGPLHPQRRELETRLADIRQRIQEEVDRILSSLEAEAATASSRVASLAGSRGAAADALAANGRAQAGLAELEQKALAARTIFENFLERSKESSALEGSQQPDARLAARAEVPAEPVSPDLRVASLLGVVLALAAGVAAVGVREYLRDGIQTKRDVEARLALRYAGAVPMLQSTLGRLRTTEAPQDYVVQHPHSLFAEAFRSIRTFLMLSAGGPPRAIAITSALPGEGKTMTSVCLARATAADGLRTVLVDLDLRRRGASAVFFPVNGSEDLCTYLDGTTPLDRALRVDEETGLHVLGVSRSFADGRSPLTEAGLRAMLTELRGRYDVIILDTAPLLGVADARLIAS
ncbi:MAG: protein-tyrosine kinase, partial [Candidatus Accumulibacter sp.]|nr:protein-tyrosine kinase [Accumulibacter sp.]